MRVPSSYSLKPVLQTLISPVSNGCVKLGIRPNWITLLGFFLCVCCSILLLTPATSRFMLMFLPLILLLKIILNALDGMIAKSAEQQTASGELLNEWCDYFADLLLFFSFAFLLPNHSYAWIVLLILLILTQLINLLLVKKYGSRAHTGPFCKSDRAIYLGIGAILFSFSGPPDGLLFLYILSGIILATITLYLRIIQLRKASQLC